MDSRLPVLESLAAQLTREESVLNDLLRSAEKMRDALIASDFALLEDVNAAMQSSASELEQLEEVRQALLASLQDPPATLDQAFALAAGLGLVGLSACRSRLASAALSLQQAQERNARLVLGAVRLRERWFNMLAGMVSPTYGAGGRQNPAPGRRFVSKSA